MKSEIASLKRKQEALEIANPAAIIFIIFWDFLMFHKIVVWPQVKRCTIINYEYAIYELPHELLNDLRLMILRN